MAPITGVTLVKRFTYRDATEEFSNKYYLTGDPPADDAHWKTLFETLATEEATVLHESVHYVRAYGYDDDALNAHAVVTHFFDGTDMPAQAGAGAWALVVPGDVAAFAEWKTDRVNTRGKPVYLRKYFHTPAQSETDNDKIGPSYKTALLGFASVMRGGSFDTSRAIRSRTHNDTIVAHKVGDYLTTRTLKRRGRRP
jgi:hypothetical protein